MPDASTQPEKRRRYGWAGTVQDLVALSRETFVSELTDHVRGLFGYTEQDRIEETLASQIRAWVDEHEVMTQTAQVLVTEHPHSSDWGVVFEYELPQEGGRRPDVIVLAGRTVIVLEFKMKNEPTTGDLDQLDGYLRDLEDFHSVAQDAASVKGTIVLTRGSPTPQKHPMVVSPADTVSYLLAHASDGDIPVQEWLDGDYQPAPGLIANAISNWTRAPKKLKTVEATNIPQAEQALHRVITVASENPGTTRHLCFLTGTPGAGKTFVGLNLVHSNIPGVSMRFLSGNGPLVKVLNYALNQRRQLITPIHEYRETFEEDLQRVPRNNVLVFDEAQRALNTAKMLSSRRKIAHSEAHSMLDIVARMDRWGVLVLLVGNGQEIYNGETGLELWFEELRDHFHDISWVLHIDPGHIPSVTEEFASHTTPVGIRWDELLPSNVTISSNENLHLTTSIRTHRAGTFHRWIDLLLAGQLGDASVVSQQVRKDHYGVYVTRSLDSARNYVRDRYQEASDSRYGIVIGSKNQAIARRHNVSIIGRDNRGVRHDKWVEKWWVDPQNHPRSCCQLDTAGTEFDCQGLDLDSTILFWADDILWNTSTDMWDVKEFQTTNPPLADPQQTRLNVYRVLLSRGRDALVIFVPPESRLDDTYAALLRSGALPLA